MTTPRRSFLTLAAIPLLLALPYACAGQADDPVEPQTARTAEAPMQAIRVELAVPADHANADEMAALAQHLEGLADIAQAKVLVSKIEEDGDAEVNVELWGQDLPTEDEVVQDLQSAFPYLVGVSIAVSAIDTVAQTPPQHDDEEDPEALRQRIIDDLRAKGVEGEIDVVITDHPDGHREVEVRVEDEQAPPPQ